MVINQAELRGPLYPRGPKPAPTNGLDYFHRSPPPTGGLYSPSMFSASEASNGLVEAAWKQLAIYEPKDGSLSRTTDDLRREGIESYAFQIHERYRVLGEPRLNRPYPDPELREAGVEQNLPMDVTSPFKWLLSKPLVLGEHHDIVLLPTQYEGGRSGFGEDEYECRDFFIALKYQPETGRFREIGAEMTREPGFQDVYRSVGPTQKVPGHPRRFGIHVEGGGYSYLNVKDTLVYEVTDEGVKQVGEWEGHIPLSDLAAYPGKAREDWHRKVS